MKSRIRLLLNPSAAQAARLVALQTAFAQACNTLAPVVQQTRCWNRVGLHHLAYRQLREQFPGLGSQMVCNAIYSVSRACRVVYQHPNSPFNLARWGQRPLPLLRFQPDAPVYFDRHTLSLKTGGVSLFTLDGRMYFQLGLSAAEEQRFRQQRLREIVLTREADRFSLTFSFSDTAPEDTAEASPASAEAEGPEWPHYVLVDEAPHRAVAAAAPTGAAFASSVPLAS